MHFNYHFDLHEVGIFPFCFYEYYAKMKIKNVLILHCIQCHISILYIYIFFFYKFPFKLLNGINYFSKRILRSVVYNYSSEKLCF